ncbi:hypothetical protein EJB05_03710, partial [Eragrostis curvula]
METVPRIGRKMEVSVERIEEEIVWYGHEDRMVRSTLKMMEQRRRSLWTVLRWRPYHTVMMEQRRRSLWTVLR